MWAWGPSSWGSRPCLRSTFADLEPRPGFINRGARLTEFTNGTSRFTIKPLITRCVPPAVSQSCRGEGAEFHRVYGVHPRAPLRPRPNGTVGRVHGHQSDRSGTQGASPAHVAVGRHEGAARQGTRGRSPRGGRDSRGVHQRARKALRRGARAAGRSHSRIPGRTLELRFRLQAPVTRLLSLRGGTFGSRRLPSRVQPKSGSCSIRSKTSSHTTRLSIPPKGKQRFRTCGPLANSWNAPSQISAQPSRFLTLSQSSLRSLG